MAGEVKAKLLSPIPFPPDQVRLNAPIRWRMGAIEMVTPLFSFYRYQLFVKSMQYLPIVMMEGKAMPFWDIMELDGEAEQVAIKIRDMVRGWKEMDLWNDSLEDIVALVMAVSDPYDLDKAIHILREWDIDNGCPLQILPDPDDKQALAELKRDPKRVRQMLHEYAIHVLSFDDLALMLSNLRQINVTFKKKLSNLSVADPEPEEISPRRNLWSRLWKKGSTATPKEH